MHILIFITSSCSQTCTEGGSFQAGEAVLRRRDILKCIETMVTFTFLGATFSRGARTLPDVPLLATSLNVTACRDAVHSLQVNKICHNVPGNPPKAAIVDEKDIE